MDYLNKINELIEASSKGPEPEGDAKTILRIVNGFCDYVAQAAHFPMEEIRIRLKYSDENGRMFDREGYQQAIKEMDEKRRLAHNRIIGSVKTLNIMCDDFKIKPFYSGDISNRYEVAEHVENVVYQLYKHEINRDRNVIDKVAEEKIAINDKMSLDELIESCKLGIKGSAEPDNNRSADCQNL